MLSQNVFDLQIMNRDENDEVVIPENTINVPHFFFYFFLNLI